MYSLLRNHPFERPIDLERGSALYAGVPAWARDWACPTDGESARLNDPDYRAELRTAVDEPERIPTKGSTIPPPRWEVTFVDKVAKTEPGSRQAVDRRDRGRAGQARRPTCCRLALADDLGTVFHWANKSPTGGSAVREANTSRSMLVGVSDGGAHSTATTAPSGRRTSSAPGCRSQALDGGGRHPPDHPRARRDGGTGRGLLARATPPTSPCRPDALQLGTKQLVKDLPGGGERPGQVKPEGVVRVIVNGKKTVVENGELTGKRAGRVLRIGNPPSVTS